MNFTLFIRRFCCIPLKSIKVCLICHDLLVALLKWTHTYLQAMTNINHFNDLETVTSILFSFMKVENIPRSALIPASVFLSDFSPLDIVNFLLHYVKGKYLASDSDPPPHHNLFTQISESFVYTVFSSRFYKLELFWLLRPPIRGSCLYFS